MVYICPYVECSKQLCSKYNLRRHIENHHNRIRRFECEICFKKLSSAQNLKEHNFLHSLNIEDAEIARSGGSSEAIEIPKLTNLLLSSNDLSLRPYLKVNRHYLFSPLN